jgi:starch phosphorylase
MVKPVLTISIIPNLPAPLARLRDLAYNLRWAWNFDTVSLFRRIDRNLWEQTGHNPVAMLGLLDQSRLEAAIEDGAFMAHYHRVLADFDTYMSPSYPTWFGQRFGKTHPGVFDKPTFAYFSMEFGITECLQNYSGGLGVLSGDHLKSASDLGVPLVGVGLLYQEGYFRQYLNADGYQQESYPINDYANLPVTLMRNDAGQPLKISVTLPGRELYAQIWRVQVGRVSLYLLDTNIADNPREDDRNLTDRLYGGDRRTRIRQELLMGIGGIRALHALGLNPPVCHMNEPHAAFLALERIRLFMQEHGVDFWEAKDIIAQSNLFTTHTPVPAGLERFGYDLIDEHFTDYYKSMGLTRDQFINLGRENMGDYVLFSMAVLALNLSSGANGVAKLHGEVSRQMWQWMYPQVPKHEIPVKSITNGIHVQTWINHDIASLLDRYLDPAWRNEEWRADIWEGVDAIPDSELWRTHERRRERLVSFARRRLVEQLKRRGAPQHEIEEAKEVLDPDALTIGFARRFATYKRATLLFTDPERLARILNHPDRPMQVIFAGKAHPHDTAGKDFIRQINNLARDPLFHNRIVFLEDYDMHIARYLVQGVDVWLNNPRRPQEASGTSGMKVIYNGGLNCSILDGWWDEGYDPSVGWAIGNGEEYPDSEASQQDYIESEALYNMLEHDIVPTFYTRIGGTPREWLAKMKNAMKRLGPYFNTHRMVQEYTEVLYMPHYERFMSLTTPTLDAGLAYAEWREKVERVWGKVHVHRLDVSGEEVKVGEPLEVTTEVFLGDLKPEDVEVQLYFGALNSRGEIGSGEALTMKATAEQNGTADSLYRFAARLTYHTSGERGLSVRVLPKHQQLPTQFLPGIIRWAVN